MTIERPKVRVVGFERPGMSFPDHARDFFPDFLLGKIKDRFLYEQKTPSMMESIRSETFQMLSIATDIYKLSVFEPVDRFWSVNILTDEIHPNEVTINVVPTTLRGCLMDIAEEAGQLKLSIVQSPRLDEVGLFVVAPSTIESFVGLARMVDIRRRHR